MKKIKQGFVVSSVLYPLLVLFLALIMGLLSMTDTRKRILDRMKLEITDSIFDSASCDCETIKQYLENIMGGVNTILKNGVSGGGSGGFGELNVTAYETPSSIPTTASVNDIAVVTSTKIANYILSPYEPTSTTEGLVWIKSDENYKALLKGTNVTIPIRVAYQYINGKWVNIQGYAYAGTDAGWKALFYSKNYTEYILNGADPELYEGLIPIEISETGIIKYADPQTEWYKYEDKKWANAVLVTNPANYKVGDTISEKDILMYYVWIPRYRYQLFNVGNSSISPFQIKIEFEDNTKTKTNGTKNGDWLTHPAFTFGTTELNGFWVGKFETSGTTTALRIKPGVTSLRNINVATMFNASRNIDLSYSLAFNIDSKEVDTHMMKNMEWGAMAYLSHTQYGTCTNNTCSEIVYNSNSGYYTGGSSSKTAWATSSYTTESTTKNRYGIYDTSGGAWEYVMGNMTNSTTVATSQYFYNSSAGFSSVPADKYIDYYTYNASDSGYLDHKRGKLGDATKETLATFGNNTGGWYQDYAYFPSATYSWFLRGGHYADGASYTGVFAFGRDTGAAGEYFSFRVVLSSE